MPIIDVSNYRNLVVLTGAGVSAASGLRTYRGKGGIWEEYNISEVGHVDRLRDNPSFIWQLFGSLRADSLSAQPNRTHRVLAHLEEQLQRSQNFTLITQNVDGLHQKAGSRNVIELHGTIHKTRCSNHECDLQPFDDTNDYANSCPLCPRCNSPLRPCIVLFGEAIPAYESWQSKRVLRDCDLFVAIGTSGTVSPAANLVRGAEYSGARTILVNLEPMNPRNPYFQEEYIGKAEELLPELFKVHLI